MLPNFMIIGAMKCGTTSLSYYLSQHKEIFIPIIPSKIQFFSHDPYYEKGREYYESFFEDVKDEKVIGEDDDEYTKGIYGKSEKSAKRIHAMLPDCKFIYIVRHPLKQIESNYLFRSVDSSEQLPFNEAVIHSKHGYLETVNYKKQLAYYYELFPKERIKVFFLEDLKRNPTQVLKECMLFLDVNPSLEGIDLTPKNVSKGKFYDTSIAKVLRKSSLLNDVAKSLPGSFKSLLSKFFKTKQQKRPEFNQETLSYVLNEIWQSSQQFLKDHDKPLEFWNLEDYEDILSS